MRATVATEPGPPPSDHAPAGVREQVRQSAAAAWGEPARVLYLRKVKMKFEVPGRRQDGTVKGTHLVRRVLRNVSRIPFLTFWLIVDLILETLPFEGFAGLAFSSAFRRGTMEGRSPDCSALPCADAANNAKRHLWLVWSERHVALIQARAESAPQTVWAADNSYLPRFRSARTLRWRDGSSIELPVDRRERRRFEQFKGAQE